MRPPWKGPLARLVFYVDFALYIGLPAIGALLRQPTKKASYLSRYEAFLVRFLAKSRLENSCK